MTTRVLMVCRANRCRSPFAAEMLRWDTRGADVAVESAGLSPSGYPMPAEGQELGRSVGMDFSRHRSREFEPADSAMFDVILAMGRDQARDIVAEEPTLWPRVFTISRFVTWIADNPWPRGRALGEWIDDAARSRSKLELVGVDAEDDVYDPYGQPISEWQRMALQLEPLVAAVARGIR